MYFIVWHIWSSHPELYVNPEPPQSLLYICHVTDSNTAEGFIDLENTPQNSEAYFQMKWEYIYKDRIMYLLKIHACISPV